MSKPDVPVDEEAFTIRSAMTDCTSHALEHRLRDACVRIEEINACYSAHRCKLVALLDATSGRLWESDHNAHFPGSFALNMTGACHLNMHAPAQECSDALNKDLLRVGFESVRRRHDEYVQGIPARLANLELCNSDFVALCLLENIH